MQVTHGSENELKQPHSPPPFMLFLSAWGKFQGVLGPKKTGGFFSSKEDNWDEDRLRKRDRTIAPIEAEVMPPNISKSGQSKAKQKVP
jgi:hypothetical protein